MHTINAIAVDAAGLQAVPRLQSGLAAEYKSNSFTGDLTR
jgi:hypothetical protein